MSESTTPYMNTEQAVDLYRKRADEIAVTDSESMLFAETVLQDLRRRKKSWLAEVEASIKASYAAWKEAVAHRDRVARPIEAAEKLIKDRIAGYVHEQRRLADAQQQRLQAEADAKAEAERKRLLKAAERIKTPDLREARIMEAETIVAPVVTVAPAVPESKLSAVVTWGYEITDAASIPREYMIPDTAKIGAVVRASKGAVTIPGVRAVRRESVKYARS